MLSNWEACHLVNAYFIINNLLHFLMYGLLVTKMDYHASALDFGDRFEKPQMLATIGISK